MLQACGITAFLSPLPTGPATLQSSNGTSESTQNRGLVLWSAIGEIKSTPEDFVVVEIDPTGQRTDSDSYSFPAADVSTPLPPALIAAVAAKGITGAEVRDGDEFHDAVCGGFLPEHLASTPKEEDVVTPTRSLHDLHCVLMEQAPAMQKALGTALEVGERAMKTFTQRDLTALIRDVQLSAQGGHEKVSPSAASSKTLWWRRSHRLGVFCDKKERQLMHMLVRRCFPHLRSAAEVLIDTSASSSSAPSSLLPNSEPHPIASKLGEAPSVLTCALDLHYVLFCATLGIEAAQCIAHWTVTAQADRQERKLDEDVRAELQLVTPVECSAVPASVHKGVCFASFNVASEAMRRVCEASGTETAQSAFAVRDEGEEGDITAVSGAQSLFLSDKDVRRHVHEVLRRFYPFLRCQVREGQVVLRYSPRPGPKSATDIPNAVASSHKGIAASSSSSCEGVAVGVRRPRDEDESEAPSAPSHDAAGGFLHLIVTKRNLDTAEMRQLIGEYCGLKDGSVCAAGMKDRKAVTTQRCSIPLATATSMLQKGSNTLAAATPIAPVVLRWPADPLNSYATVRCGAQRSAPVHLGQLEGNWFSVQVRNVRWALPTKEETSNHSDAFAPTAGETVEGQASPLSALPPSELRTFLEGRFRLCVERGFINYFGQQRFGETISRADDHTGVHLFAGRWVDAVKSLYRACPEVYDAFPAKMEARFVPGNLRDAQVMTHTLRQTYRMYFSEYALTREDVQHGSELWTRLCERAITEGVAYFLRSLWVHGGQSVFFNLTASFLVEAVQSARPPASPSALAPALPSSSCGAALPPLSYAALAKSQLPLGGYQVSRALPEIGAEESSAVWRAWRASAIQHALHTLRWTEAQAFEQRKVAGVPVPGSWRTVVVRPRDAALEWEAATTTSTHEGGDAAARLSNDSAVAPQPGLPSMRLSFALPSSSYATIFLREVLGCDKWW